MEKHAAISLVLAFVFLPPLVLQGQERIVQGKIVKVINQRKTAFRSIPVTLYNKTKKNRSDPSFTDINGKYYFYNIPEGTYELEIWKLGRVNAEHRSNNAEVVSITVDYDQAVSRKDYDLLTIPTKSVKIE